jgi:hypothetical protein
MEAKVTYRVLITTRYLGPTNFKGSRIVADAGLGRRVILSWHSENTSDENHSRAAMALVDKMGWDHGTETLYGGSKEKGGGMVWVFVPNSRGKP